MCVLESIYTIFLRRMGEGLNYALSVRKNAPKNAFLTKIKAYTFSPGTIYVSMFYCIAFPCLDVEFCCTIFLDKICIDCLKLGLT